MGDELKITGLGARLGETVTAFCIVRLSRAADSAALRRLTHSLVQLIDGDVDEFVASIPDQLDEPKLVFALPWAPPSADELATQEATLRSSAKAEQIDQAWFFQVETSADDLPPQLIGEPAFPVDGIAQTIEEFDWYDFGIAIKLGKPSLPGEYDLLDAFHAMWLGPIAGHFRNTDVTIDRTHRAVHFWADRFTAPLSPEESVRNLLWIVESFRQIVPVVHATFQPATMEQKYSGLMGDTSEPFILAGNPLLNVHQRGGFAATIAWIEQQSDWSAEEIARMLQPTAIDTLSAPGKHGSPTKKSTDAACLLLEKALELSPSDDEVQYTFGRVLLVAGRVEELANKLAGFEIGTRLVLLNAIGSDKPSAFKHGLETVLGNELPETVLGTNNLSCGSGATVSSFGDQSASLFGELATHVATLAPNRIDELLTRLPSDILTLSKVAQSLSQAGHNEATLNINERIAELPVPPHGTNERANYCRALNNGCVEANTIKAYSRAAALADKAQPYGHENPWIYHSAACAYVGVGDLERALEQVELAASHNYPNLAPDSAGGASSNIETESLGGLLEWPRFKDVFVRWRKALPSYVKGSEALQAGEPAEAVTSLVDACFESSPLARMALINLGLAHGQLGDYETMWEVSRNALRRFPEDPDLLANLIQAARERGRLGEAVEPVLECYKHQRDEPRTAQNITYVLNEAKQYSDTLDAIEWWIETHGPLPTLAMNNAANANLKTGNLERGLSWARRNVDDDDSANTQWMLSFALLMTDDLNGALDAARQCLVWDEDVFEKLAVDRDMARLVADPRFANLRKLAVDRDMARLVTDPRFANLRSVSPGKAKDKLPF